MSAKATNLARIQEVYDIATQTRAQIARLGFTRDMFLEPATDEEDLIAEGILNRVFRVAEEAGYIDEDVATTYGFDTVGARGVRNRLAHVYGEVDRDLVWSVIENDFPVMLLACKRYCDDVGVDIG